jgi:CheY-like chemotaxis protein/predicted negative regulator of RcsB-dependent stress response
MNLADSRLKQLDNPTLTLEERVLLRCRVAAELIHIGKYEDARDALGELWRGVGDPPNLRGLSTPVAAEVLLQCGVLSGWLGSVRQIPEAQEKAKDLLTEAHRKFKSQGQRIKVSETQYELGLCYWRAGAYDEARVILSEAFKALEDKDAELKAKIIIRRASVEIWTGKYHNALDVLKEAEQFFEKCNDAIKGRWHGQMAIVLGKLASAERNTAYLDRAIIEYTAAIYHYEQAKHERYAAINLNNTAMLLYEFGRYEDAHEHLDRAVSVLTRLKDDGLLAQVKETRARVLIAERRYQEANLVIAEAIKTFEKGDEWALLADALTLQGVVLSRLRFYDRSIHVLRRAINLAQDSGALSSAGLAALTLIEEHGEARLPESELCNTYLRADTLLKSTQDAEEVVRIRTCASILARRLSISHAILGDESFSLPDVVLAYEGRLIEQALDLEGGKLSRAAQRLGVTRQRLTHILKTRHRSLWHKRTPVSQRRSYTGVRKPRKTGRTTVRQKARPVSILVVEDNPTVADAVREILEFEGWRVELCTDGTSAGAKLEGGSRFDLLIFDYQLPDEVNGVELIRLARSLKHTTRTPIIMLSASDVEIQARDAGVTVFLRKPQDIGRLTAAVSRLLSEGK